MEDNYRTRQYLKQMEAIPIETKIRIELFNLPSYIFLYKRTYYLKRNKKKCYVDTEYKYTKPILSQIKKKYYRNVISTGENDWNPLVLGGTYYKITKEYREFLIDNFDKFNDFR